MTAPEDWVPWLIILGGVVLVAAGYPNGRWIVAAMCLGWLLGCFE